MYIFLSKQFTFRFFIGPLEVLSQSLMVPRNIVPIFIHWAIWYQNKWKTVSYMFPLNKLKTINIFKKIVTDDNEEP